MNIARKTAKQWHPPGLDELGFARIPKLAEQYDNQTEDEQVPARGAAMNVEGQAAIALPTELVPEIVKLIKKKT